MPDAMTPALAEDMLIKLLIFRLPDAMTAALAEDMLIFRLPESPDSVTSTLAEDMLLIFRMPGAMTAALALGRALRGGLLHRPGAHSDQIFRLPTP